MILGALLATTAWAAPLTAWTYARWVEDVGRRIEADASRILESGCPSGPELASALRDLTGPWPGRIAAESAALRALDLGPLQIQSWYGQHPEALAELRARVDLSVAKLAACVPGLDPFEIDLPGRGEIAWQKDVADALAQASASGRPLLLFASAPWKLGTAVMDNAVWTNEIATRAVASLAVPARVEWASTSAPPNVGELLTGYLVGTELPTLQLFDASGRACEGLMASGYVEPDHVVTLLLMARGAACHSKGAAR